MSRNWGTLILCVGFGLLAAGCPKGHGDYNLGEKAENLQDWDAAYTYYQKAVKAEPHNAGYKIKLDITRFEAGQSHIKKGLELRKRGDVQSLQLASGEFQRALTIDPASSIAEQELNKTAEMLAEKNRQNEPPPTDQNLQPLASMPPEIKPLSRAPTNLKMSNDAKLVFDTLGKLAGLTMVYDPDFPARRITVDFNNATLEQALETTALESKAVIKPVTENTLFIYQDTAQKRHEYEEEVVKTFYLSNVTQPQDITEIMTGLRQLFDLKRVQQVNAQNAIIVRDTPDKMLLIQKVIDDIDKAKPEVLVQVEVLEVSTQRIRELGITPGQTASVTFTPGTTTPSSSGGSSTTSTPLTLNNLKHLSTADYSVTLPSATATALLSDSATKILQNPEIRSVDGQISHLRIGQRIPVATGSFQAGVGVGATGGAGFVNPLVNTQFTYLDVGVNVDMTPRVHPDREVSLRLVIDITSHTSDVNIGGITQPVIGQRKIEHDIRLKEGEVNILGGLFQRTDTETLSGWPGLGKLPILGRLFSDKRTEHDEQEVLIVLTPRIVRMPMWTRANLRPLLSGSDQTPQVTRESEILAPQAEQAPPTPQQPRPQQMPPASTTPTASTPGASPANAGEVAKIRFEPQTLTLKVGQTATMGVVVENVNDLYSIPLLLQYDPKVIGVEEVQHGGFLSNGGAQEISIVSQPFKDKGQYIISATRPPSTPGVSGSGTLLGLVLKAIAPGSSPLSIVQVNAKDSQQKSIPLVTSEATLRVQP
jgi:general secretion pathway protein D